MKQLNMMWSRVSPARYLGLTHYGTTLSTVPVCGISMKTLNLLRPIMAARPLDSTLINADQQPVTIHVYTSR